MTKEEIVKMLNGSAEENADRVLKLLADSGSAWESRWSEREQEFARERDGLREAADRAVLEQRLESVLREKGARSVRAAKALLHGQLQPGADADEVERAVEELRLGEDGAVLFGAAPTGEKTDVGGGELMLQKVRDPAAVIRAAAGLL